jgi:hypothetical protein
MFESLDVSSMNETDVREAIVRPLIRALGYRHGAKANIRTEITLRYDRAYLGHKDADKDPKLQGRADYVCEVIPYGRWIIEVKSPKHDLGLEDAQQTHTYAAHPEIQARFYVVTNGREFKIYQTGAPFHPLLSWRLEETEQVYHAVSNILAPDAIERAGKFVVDRGQSLGPDLRSTARIVGGSMTYSGNSSDNPALSAAMKPLQGLRNVVRGQEVRRTPEGLIEARIELAPAFNAFDELNRSLGFIPTVFRCADEAMSSDPANPSIFSNIFDVTVPRGTTLPASPLLPGGVLPIDCRIIYYNKAVGHLDGHTFSGMFRSEQEFAPSGQPMQFVIHWGLFELQLA